MGPVVDILGVTFDHQRGINDLQEDRRKKLILEIKETTASDRLTSGRTGKLRGKLMHAAGLHSGRHGRAYLRALSYRQYSNSTSTSVSSSSGPPKGIVHVAQDTGEWKAPQKVHSRHQPQDPSGHCHLE